MILFDDRVHIDIGDRIVHLKEDKPNLGLTSGLLRSGLYAYAPTEGRVGEYGYQFDGERHTLTAETFDAQHQYPLLQMILKETGPYNGLGTVKLTPYQEKTKIWHLPTIGDRERFELFWKQVAKYVGLELKETLQPKPRGPLPIWYTIKNENSGQELTLGHDTCQFFSIDVLLSQEKPHTEVTEIIKRHNLQYQLFYDRTRLRIPVWERIDEVVPLVRELLTKNR